MTLFIQDHETEDFAVVPNKGESLMLDGKWYDVVERIFSFKHLTNIDSNSCTLFVEESSGSNI